MAQKTSIARLCQINVRNEYITLAKSGDGRFPTRSHFLAALNPKDTQKTHATTPSPFECTR